jgi:Plasmid pRiA4b ORF-3-like protein
MDKRWLGIRVDLLSGRGETLQPSPGREFAVPLSCTFDDFGRAIDLAFARWDLSHLRQFELEDGTLVVDEETADELRASPFGGGAIPRTVLLDTKVGRHVKVGTRFRYIFDLGDNWTHSCTVEGRVDPLEALGVVPDRPVAYFGWGTIPDQYGRRWDADDGESEPPVTSPPEVEQLGWSAPRSTPLIDRTELRRAVASGRPGDVIEAVSAADIETALQQVGAGLLTTYRTARGADRTSLSPVLITVSQRLQRRGWVGDDVLAAEMLAELRGEEPNGRAVPVDLDELSYMMADHDAAYPGGYLNIETGEVVPAVATDAGMVGEEAAVDLEDGDWVHVLDESRDGWQDMADFASAVEDRRTRETLEDAVQGKGAFSRFRRAIDRADLDEAWHCFADDRRWGRARQELADQGLRPV